MKTYVIRLSWQGHFYEDTIRATSYFDARRLIEARYPGCSIWNVAAQ